MKRITLIIAAIGTLLISVHAGSLKKIAAVSGVAGGVAVHIGCGNGKDTVDLYQDEKLLVYGLDTDAEAVEKAKAYIASKGLYGQVSAEVFDGKNLPFGDNIANLVICDEVAGGRWQVAREEILRVLVPGGVAVIGGKKTVKPVPSDIDDWTHFLYDASNNAVSKGKRGLKPNRLQWFAGPRHTRDHDALASMSAMTSSGGRVFYIYDEGPVSVIHQPAEWKLIARDAFNGKLLWKREIPDWMTHLYNFRGGPVQLPRRLVSVGDEVFVTLGLNAPVQKLDAVSGKTLKTFKGTEKVEEFIVHDGLLLAVKGNPDLWIEKSDGCVGYWEMAEFEEHTDEKEIMAYDIESGKLKWKLESEDLKSLVPLSLCAQGDKVLYADGKKVRCVDAGSGRELWASVFETEGVFLRSYTPSVAVQDDVIVCMYDKRTAAFSVHDGKLLWELGEGSIGFGSPGDLFIRDGVLWTLPMSKTVKNQYNVLKPRHAVQLDIRSGKVLKEIPFVINQHHHRCYRNKATQAGIIIGYSGIQVFDWEKGVLDLNQWVRGLCQYGFMPANGYTYVPPDPCRCYSDVKINGFFALSEKNSLDGIEIKPVLEKGEAYSEAGGQKTEDSQGWSTYRGNAARSGGTDEALPEKLKVKWEADVGATPTASVIAGGRVYVADRDSYTVYCLNAGNGKELWRYMANGPVDSPPAIVGGRTADDRLQTTGNSTLCVFGCGDGSVYCLNGEGKLAWRFKVSGVERRIGSEDRLESPWRINGSVLVLDGTVYFAAGRSSHLDGGIKLYGLDLVTGAQKHFRELKSTLDDKAGHLADILVQSGSGINMRGAGFDLSLAPKGGRTTSMEILNGSWHHRQQGALGSGKLNVSNAAGTFSVGNPYTGMKKKRSVMGKSTAGIKYNQVGHFHQKYTRYKEEEWFPVGVSIKGKGWAVNDDIQPRAMVAAGDRLYLAGWIDQVAVELKTGRPLKGREREPVLRVFSAKDGSRIVEYKLDAEPVWDSASAADGKLFLSLQNGRLICMGE